MSTSQPQTTQEEAEITALVASLQARLVASGEWGRLQKQLRRSLDGSQWDKDLKDFAREKALAEQGNIHLADLAQIVKPQAKSTLPAELKDTLLNDIRRFVEQNVED